MLQLMAREIIRTEADIIEENEQLRKHFNEIRQAKLKLPLVAIPTNFDKDSFIPNLDLSLEP
jgi:hypothetical protein